MADNLTHTEKPEKVKQAIWLLILSMTISFISGFMKGMAKQNEYHNSIGTPFPTRQFISTTLLFLIIISITWFILYNVNAGKNWARIICSFIVLLGASYFILYISYYFKENIIHASIRTIQTVLDITAIAFLNSKEVLEWYKLKNIKSTPE